MNVSEEILEDILNNSVTVDETLQSVEYVVEGLMIGVVGSVGCFSNIIGVILSWRRTSKHSFNR